MNRLLDVLAGLSMEARVTLVLVLLVQIGLQVWALIHLARRRRVVGGKWLWLAIIVLLNMLGPLIYFAAARGTGQSNPEEGVEVAGAAGDRGRRAVDVLYGNGEER